MQRLLDVFNGLAFVFVALDGDSFSVASGKAQQLMGYGTLSSVLDEVLADALGLVHGFGTWAIVLTSLYLGNSAGVWSLSGELDESLYDFSVGFLASVMAGYL